MIPWIRKLLWDETAFVRYARAGLLAAGSLWTVYQVDGELSWRTALGAVLGGLGGLIGAGDKNPRTGATGDG